jgi:osmoprotectant transport system ATP-binding protein
LRQDDDASTRESFADSNLGRGQGRRKSNHQLGCDSIASSHRLCNQEAGLFPHFTVAENVGIVPSLENWDQNKVAARVSELLSLVGLEPAKFADRYPRELSGGQRQRVGVARALAADPPLLLMDEPFGALDPLTRASLQKEFDELKSRLGKTVIFVTHDVQ